MPGADGVNRPPSKSGPPFVDGTPRTIEELDEWMGEVNDHLAQADRPWVLIADGARARILSNDGPGHGLHAVEGQVFEGDHSATHDLVTDRQGRTHGSQGPGRTAIPSPSDPHRELKVKFAQRLATALAAGLEQHECA